MIEMIKIKKKTPPSLSDPKSKQGQHHQHKTGRIQKEGERKIISKLHFQHSRLLIHALSYIPKGV
ncbi:hypothetical protein BCR42DRAFT_400127, partial [Absidia repens]